MSEKEKGRFPSQCIPNPKGQFAINSPDTSQEQVQSIVTLRSGKQVDNEVHMPIEERPAELDKGKNPKELVKTQEPSVSQPTEIEPKVGSYIPKAPFPQRLVAPKKDLVTVKRKINVPKKAFLTEQVSSIIQRKVPVKYKDPGCPTISCTIGDHHIEQALLDLEASVNLLPYSVYLQLGLGELKPTSVILKLADRSVKIPRGVIEDVLIRVDKFYFPIDFIVLDTQPAHNSNNQIPVILGRPFLATSNVLINCWNGVMKISFGNMMVELNIFDISKQPPTEEEASIVCLIDSLVHDEFIESSYEDPLEACLAHFGCNLDIDESIEQVNALLDSIPVMNINKWQPKLALLLISLTSSLPSLVEPPKLELKPLPNTLKYVFFGPSESLLVIIASDLEDANEHKLLEVLKEHKEAIGWSINDIKGISPSIVMHRIHLEEDAKPSREPQRRLNPHMHEVVSAKILKLLNAGKLGSRWTGLFLVCMVYPYGVVEIENPRNGEVFKYDTTYISIARQVAYAILELDPPLAYLDSDSWFEHIYLATLWAFDIDDSILLEGDWIPLDP
ncbi:uncharacterized protein LOC114294434 [Camellia sinensis]|uniref:uncharacterized protein LOC114294434 n=1 Tax=Camellia sinensis TaxID=4442 RepID=UPI001035CCBB|nr:uncharacterized protein LOC114294434 [Camellia sinensis]